MATAKKTEPVAEAAPTVDLPSAAEARAVLERGLRTLRAFQDADRALALLENLEQVQRERQAAADAALTHKVDVDRQMAEATEELAACKAKGRELVESAKARADKAEQSANERAKAMLHEAEGRVEALRAEADALVAQCLEKQAEITALNAQADEARALIERAEKIRSALQ
jgi:chromosome segregation ATPase